MTFEGSPLTGSEIPLKRRDRIPREESTPFLISFKTTVKSPFDVLVRSRITAPVVQELQVTVSATLRELSFGCFPRTRIHRKILHFENGIQH